MCVQFLKTQNARSIIHRRKMVCCKKWEGCCWCNPPYGRDISKWVEKAYKSECKVVMLLPARTDTKWFHDYCMKGKIEFLKGRLKFGKANNSAPFPSMIVIFEQE